MIPDSQSPNKVALSPGEADFSTTMDLDDIYDVVLPPSNYTPANIEEPLYTPRETTPKATPGRRLTPLRTSESQNGGEDVGLGKINGESEQTAGTKRRERSLDGVLASPSDPPPPKRRRTEDDTDSFAIISFERPEAASRLEPITHHETEYSKSISHSLIFPFIKGGRTPRTPRTPDYNTRRHLVSGLNGELISESSSVRITAQELQQDKGKPTMVDDGRIEDEIVDDSTEMEYLPSSLPTGPYPILTSTPAITH